MASTCPPQAYKKPSAINGMLLTFRLQTLLVIVRHQAIYSLLHGQTSPCQSSGSCSSSGELSNLLNILLANNPLGILSPLRVSSEDLLPSSCATPCT